MDAGGCGAVEATQPPLEEQASPMIGATSEEQSLLDDEEFYMQDSDDDLEKLRI